MSNDTWSPSDYRKNASFVYSPAFSAPVLELLHAQSGDRILDLGCGTGELDIYLAKIVGSQGLVLATDASESMISKARTIQDSPRHLEFRILDAASLPPKILPTDTTKYSDADMPQFDAVFSNAALHWILKQATSKVDVLRSVHCLLSPREPSSSGKSQYGGRFVGEFGGFLNICGVRSAIWRALKIRGYDPASLDPWYFPSVAEFQTLLEEAMFEVKHIELVPRITILPGSLVDWLRTFFLGGFIQQTSDQTNEEAQESKKLEAEEIMQQIQSDCEVDCKDPFTGKWSIMYVRLRFVALAKLRT